jgi:hypothetical protein
LAIIAGCKPKKLLTVAKKPVDSPTVSPVIEKELAGIKTAQLNFNTFSGRAKTHLEVNKSSNDVTMNIRISRGQKIWVSITAIAGIEVARALITPDSILVINKLQGIYLRKPFSYIYKYAGDQLDYQSVEALFVGNAIPQLINDRTYMQTDSGKVDLTGTLGDLAYKLVIGPDSKALTTNLSNPAESQSVQVDNSVFIQSANRILPSQINISSAAGTKKLKMNMHYIRADFDQPLEFPFTIPSGYEEGH